MSKGLNYVSQATATLIDERLMGSLGFELAQLVEQAGLASALAASRVFPRHAHAVVLVGPGNNGADGLVCARMLKLFGFECSVVYPRPGKNPLMNSLITQCKSFDIPVLDNLPEPPKEHFYVDSLFGFSFKHPIRPPFDCILSQVIRSGSPVFSIDIPSGWDVESGPPEGESLSPIGLISLTVPKKGVEKFVGRHFLGGRFVPRAIIEEFSLEIPQYPGEDLIMELNNNKL